jgi:hypothetical protein
MNKKTFPIQIGLFLFLMVVQSNADLRGPLTPPYKAVYFEFKVHWHFLAKEFPIGLGLQASFMERNHYSDFLGYGANIGVETQGLQRFYIYTEVETGFEPFGIAVGPVLKLERYARPHLGIQGSGWIGIQGWHVLPDVRFRYIRNDGCPFSMGLMLKVPLYFYHPADTI